MEYILNMYFHFSLHFFTCLKKRSKERAPFPQVFLLRKTGSKTWPKMAAPFSSTTQAFLSYTWEKEGQN
jgi:hypothetical protein